MAGEPSNFTNPSPNDEYLNYNINIVITVTSHFFKFQVKRYESANNDSCHYHALG